MVVEGWMVVTGGEFLVQSRLGTGFRFLSRAPALSAGDKNRKRAAKTSQQLACQQHDGKWGAIFQTDQLL